MLRLLIGPASYELKQEKGISMMPQWLFSACLQFVIRQLMKYGESTDFDLVLKDFIERANKLFPALDSENIREVEKIIDVIKKVAEIPSEINNIRLHIKEGDYYLASQSLKYIITEKLWLS